LKLSLPSFFLSRLSSFWIALAISVMTLSLAPPPASAQGSPAGGKPAPAQAWVVVESRGTPYASGSTLAPETRLSLAEGARITLIARTGRSLTLRGVFEGSVPAIEGAQDDPKRALSALIALRDERSRAIGVIRGNEAIAPLPEPWLLDISRSGPRCLRPGEPAELWRAPGVRMAAPMSIWPNDRSWRLDLQWLGGLERLPIPRDVLPAEGQSLIVGTAGADEIVIVFTFIAAGVTDPILVAAWMLERGCVQQADALIKQLQARPDFASAPKLHSGPGLASSAAPRP
jgi:hypothetical protein